MCVIKSWGEALTGGKTNSVGENNNKWNIQWTMDLEMMWKG